MDCEKIRILFLDEAEKAPSIDGRPLLEGHLTMCRDCREEFDSLKKLFEALKAMDAPEPGASFWEKFPERVLKEAKAEKKRLLPENVGHGPGRAAKRSRMTSPWMARLVPIAAAAAVITAATFFSQAFRGGKNAGTDVLESVFTEDELIEINARLSPPFDRKDAYMMEGAGRFFDDGVFLTLLELDSEELDSVYKRLGLEEKINHKKEVPS